MENKPSRLTQLKVSSQPKKSNISILWTWITLFLGRTIFQSCRSYFWSHLKLAYTCGCIHVFRNQKTWIFFLLICSMYIFIMNVKSRVQLLHMKVARPRTPHLLHAVQKKQKNWWKLDSLFHPVAVFDLSFYPYFLGFYSQDLSFLTSALVAQQMINCGLIEYINKTEPLPII